MNGWMHSSPEKGRRDIEEFNRVLREQECGVLWGVVVATVMMKAACDCDECGDVWCFGSLKCVFLFPPSLLSACATRRIKQKGGRMAAAALSI